MAGGVVRLMGERKMSVSKTLKIVAAVLGVMLCMGAGILLYQVKKSPGSVSRNMDLGNKYLLAEDYDSAISAFSKAIAIDGMNADAYIGRGDAYKAKEEYANAWADYEKAQDISGDTNILRNRIGPTVITVVSPDGAGVDGAAVRLIGSDHSYDFVTDSTGSISEVVFPEKYSVEINKESYETVKTELSAESGGIVVDQIEIKFVDEVAGAVEAVGAAQANKDRTFMGITTLEQGVESRIDANGSTYRIRYDDAGTNDGCVRLNLYVNDIVESYSNDSVMGPFQIDVYVTDIDISDSYYNIAVTFIGEDSESRTALFAFNDSDISMIGEFDGWLVPESASGDGTVLLEFDIGVAMRDYGSFVARPEISVHDLSAEQVKVHSGRKLKFDSAYEDGFVVPLTSNLTVYADVNCTSAVGTIPAGTSVRCEYPEVTAYGKLHVTGGSVSGYVTRSMLKESCQGMALAG